MSRLVQTSPTAPLVSVVTATYNWSSVLRQAITSVQRQTLTELEMFIVGDPCTDDSWRGCCGNERRAAADEDGQ